MYITISLLILLFYSAECKKCDMQCPDEGYQMLCAFDIHNRVYKMFPSTCAMAAYAQCYQLDFIKTPLKFCIKDHFPSTRRFYGESCPAFCPSHYRPVCAASKYRSYLYRSFINGCYLDMINCRGDDDFTGYVEVPLSFCQKHYMKNIFKEKLVISNINDYQDYE